MHFNNKELLLIFLGEENGGVNHIIFQLLFNLENFKIKKLRRKEPKKGVSMGENIAFAIAKIKGQ